ncbi:MAG: hypothetical protein KBD16_01475 [Candidatus Pacebacteria bacterium]|nr:hypothetical protein [Candidatus Paceibacterota bacterium]
MDSAIVYIQLTGDEEVFNAVGRYLAAKQKLDEEVLRIEDTHVIYEISEKFYQELQERFVRRGFQRVSKDGKILRGPFFKGPDFSHKPILEDGLRAGVIRKGTPRQRRIPTSRKAS